jgi:thiol-disulfide isomerase/thioredoxin
MWFMKLQLWLTEHTSYGTFASQFEQQLFGEDMFEIPFSPSTAMGLPVLPKMARAPEFAGLGPWHNSEPFTLESLKGKVVLVDFWTYSCINCIRTLPYIQGYWDTFKDKPFVLIGVHAPEFVFEKSEKNVAQAVREYGLTYPIAQDNDFGTWRAFANRYWPAKYLIDANGIIRYTHFGEGAYDETNLAIQSLLAEIGAIEVPMPMSDTAARTYRKQTPETYLGERSWPVLGNAQGEPTSAVVSYTLPESRATPLLSPQRLAACGWRAAGAPQGTGTDPHALFGIRDQPGDGAGGGGGHSGRRYRSGWGNDAARRDRSTCALRALPWRLRRA